MRSRTAEIAEGREAAEDFSAKSAAVSEGSGSRRAAGCIAETAEENEAAESFQRNQRRSAASATPKSCSLVDL